MRTFEIIDSFFKKHFHYVWNPFFPTKILLWFSLLFPSNKKPFPHGKREGILVVKLDFIGDIVVISAFLRELRRNYPAAAITLVVNPRVFNLIEYCPHVDTVLIFAPTDRGKIRNYLNAARFSRQHFLSYNYRIAIFPRWDYDFTFSSRLIFLSNAPLRIGFSESVNPVKEQKNRGYNSFFSKIVEEKKICHEVEYPLHLINELGGNVQSDELEIWTTPADDTFVQNLFTKLDIDKQAKLVLCCPGAGELKRKWPIEKFSEVCMRTSWKYSVKIIVVGSAEESSLGEQLYRTCSDNVYNMVGKLSLRQIASLMKRCLLYVGNDSGLMHIAAALKLPVVEISCHPEDGDKLHANSPYRWHPWKTKYDIVQPKSALLPCSKWCDASFPHCISTIEVEQVEVAIDAFLSCA